MSERKYTEITGRVENLKKEIDESLNKYGKCEDDEEENKSVHIKTVEDKIEGLKEDVKNLKKLKKQQRKLQKLESEKDEVLREIDKERNDNDHHRKKR